MAHRTVSGEILLEIVKCCQHDIITLQILLFISNTSPEPLDEKVIQRSLSPIPTHANVGSFQTTDKIVTDKLHVLIVLKISGRSRRSACSSTSCIPNLSASGPPGQRCDKGVTRKRSTVMDS